MAEGMRKPGKTVAKAAASVEPAVADTFKQTSAQQGPVHPSTSEEVSMAGRMKQPGRLLLKLLLQSNLQSRRQVHNRGLFIHQLLRR